MSKDFRQEFDCLVLFAALSGRSFTKSQLGIEMPVTELERLSKETGLLSVTKKGRSRDLKANEETFRWAGSNLNMELTGKGKAVMEILHLLRARTAGFLQANQISFTDFVQPASTMRAPVGGPTGSDASGPDVVSEVRRAYLSLSGGSYKARILLKDLRKQLSTDRKIQDAAFFELIRSGEADFYPEDDPMSRNEEDESAALQIADRRRHVVYLHSEPRA